MRANALASGDTVAIIGFGAFATKARGARQGRNPRTDEIIDIPASNTPSFTAGKDLHNALK